tara:strand:- start:5771 stop:6490 length:720 start_codon:yes stop_codon:yes gene_type:complete
MAQYKIGVLIPTTSRNRPLWKNIQQTTLYNTMLPSFFNTLNPEHKYTFYIGIDPHDRIFSNEMQITKILNVYRGVKFKFIKLYNVKNGHLTRMWNMLFKIAYNDNCNYFYQCGDDIKFLTKGWVNASIVALKKNNNIGISGPITQNIHILTQVMVSRKHMDIFGWFFPEEILNWFCDNWYCSVYRRNNYIPLLNYKSINMGGKERYIIADTDKIKNDVCVIINRDKLLLEKYFSNIVKI